MIFNDIRAVVFDAVGTVIYPSPRVAEAYRLAIEKHFGVEIEDNVVRTAVAAALEQRSSNPDLTTSETAEKEFWAALIRSICPESDGFEACFADLFDHFARPASWRCYPDTGEAMQRLHAAHIVTALASNFDLRLNSVCDGLPELQTIKNRIISSEIGWRKPAPQFFDAVINVLSVAPEEILFVGDGIVNDVEGALSAGMQAAWICREDTEQKPPEGCVPIRTLTEIELASDCSSNNQELTDS